MGVFTPLDNRLYTCYTTSMTVDKPKNKAEKPLNMLNDDELAELARKAIDRLKELRAQFKHGWIELEDVKKEAPPLIAAFDAYGQRKAKKFGMRHRKFSLSAFLR